MEKMSIDKIVLQALRDIFKVIGPIYLKGLLANGNLKISK